MLPNNLLEQRIRSRTAQLQESNDDLRGLAYSLAHDLRAPLSFTLGDRRGGAPTGPTQA